MAKQAALAGTRARVVLLSTGGTIASRRDEASGHTVASVAGAGLLAQIPSLAELAEIEIEDVGTAPSFDLTPAFGHGLAARIRHHLARPEIAGVVVTHGTDTMEETCYLVDLLVAAGKPVVFTGAQRAHDAAQPDGPGNLLDAVRVAGAEVARGLGVLLCFAGQIHAARDVTKLSTVALATFQSPGLGPLGEVDGEQVLIRRQPPARRHFAPMALAAEVALLRLYLGFDPRLVEAALALGAKGLVLEAFGRGNGPAALVPVVAQAVAAEIPVVICSRCLTGRVMPIYGKGGGRDLAEAGALFAGDLKGPKARLLLMVLLAEGLPLAEIRRQFAELAP